MKDLVLVAVVWSLVGCSTLDGPDYGVFDPYESANRKSYQVTDKIDEVALQPVARGYQKIVPDWLERGIGNIFQNLRTLPSSINGFLQGKPRRGGTDLARLLINSTLGVGGFFDIANRVDLPFQDEDFGQTLAVWGYKKSRYVYLPMLGPSTIRDIPSTLIRGTIPRLILGHEYHWAYSALDVVSARADLLSATDVRQASALDPYAFTRDAYIQRRKYVVYDGQPPLDDGFDDFDDAFDSESDSDAGVHLESDPDVHLRAGSAHANHGGSALAVTSNLSLPHRD